MANVLSAEKRQQVIALGRLGWSLRRIEEATGVRRETASAYLQAASVPVRSPGRWGQPSKPANAPGVSTDSAAAAAAKPAKAEEVSTDSGPPRPGRSPAASACEPYRELIGAALARGRNAMAIWQDLVDGHGFPAGYASVMRFVRHLRGAVGPEAHAIIQTAPGEEGQVDYGTGPMVRDPATRKYRRTRLFVFTLGYSRKSVRLLTFRSSTRLWAELHERAFQRLGGAPAVVVLDYVARHIVEVLCPRPICGRAPGVERRRGGPREVGHIWITAMPAR
jgi:transposase